MKIIHPDVSAVEPNAENIITLLRSDDGVRGLRIENADMTGLEIKSVSIEESLIVKVNFLQIKVEKFETRDCVYKDCDFTASSLANSSWYIIEINGSRCSGTQLQSSTLRNIKYKNCKIELANFRFASLENVIFEDCMINDVDFYNASLKNVAFSGSSIENISFAGARLKNVDLSDAQLISVKNSAGLRGATISYEQLTSLSPYFAQELGILVKN